ncbi:AAA family ATPase [Xenorhabdus bovienii]|uniref:AAA family ATPase n=1 Tax=Xenorhabdus bovienii TaxID=40576 RepID=UPI0004D70452|nr:AAA family ATPase [Xenorhabdus bovienii]CDG86865.1 hypothetical protein XBFFR1_1340016 [Xenorhabdus bovienii str. feltiae France]CDG92193.1 hypothetical protein XBFFL1_2030016 [Xenorhabdus bovienii str. feltiae Florida]
MNGRLLVIKDENHSENPDMGLVIPLAHLNENGSITEIQPKEFPNGGIFVSKNFLSINQSFKIDEIFILNEYFDSEENDWKSNSRLQKHYTLGNKASKLERYLFMPVLDLNLPDSASGFLDYTLDLPSNYLFIQNGSYVYGPFKATKQNDNWILSPLVIPSPLQLPTDFVAKIPLTTLNENDALVTIKVKGVTKKFIKNLKEISVVQYEQIDCISDVKLISYFTKNNFGKGKNSLLGKSEAQRLSQGIEEYIKKNKAMGNTDRLSRIRKLLSDFLEKSDYGSEIINEFLAETRDGRLYLDQYFEKNRDFLLKEKNKELEEQFESKKIILNNELKVFERSIINKREELNVEFQNIEIESNKAKKRIEEIKKQSDEDAHQALLEKQKELTEQNSKLETTIQDKKTIIDNFMATHKGIDDFNTLNKEIDYLVRKKQDLDAQYRDADNSLKIRESMLESPKLQEKVAELSMLTTILRGEKRKSTIIQNESMKIKYSDIILDKNNRGDYINYLIQSFSSDGGKNFTFDEMTNLVINISQSFMTILSGPPGTGKTSTAIRLAKHLGLVDDDLTFSGSNFLNVAVGRAWVSGRDILGFYNSLKDLYQPSRTGLYEFLKSNENNEYLKLVLLDEANLSSIEHYWSDFLGMCDPEGANRKIDTGIPTTTERFFSVPKNLRFLATINNDSTTEKLSPRLIDRVPIITMEHNFNYKSLPSQILDFNGALSFESLDNAFNISANDASFTQDEETTLDSILEILSSPIARTTSIKVSQRKINAMKRYCHIANEIESMHVAPLDYAINQHVIPLIEGYGSSFKERLIDLEQKLSECNFLISKLSINNIINHGDIYGDSYSYF